MSIDDMSPGSLAQKYRKVERANLMIPTGTATQTDCMSLPWQLEVLRCCEIPFATIPDSAA